MLYELGSDYFIAHDLIKEAAEIVKDTEVEKVSPQLEDALLGVKALGLQMGMSSLPAPSQAEASIERIKDRFDLVDDADVHPEQEAILARLEEARELYTGERTYQGEDDEEE